MADLLVLQRRAKSMQNGSGSSSKTLDLGPSNWKPWSRPPKRAVDKNATASFAKRKKDRAISPNDEIARWKRFQMGNSRFLARKKRIK